MKTGRSGWAESGRIGDKRIAVIVVVLVIAMVVGLVAFRFVTARILDHTLLDQSLNVPGIEDPATGASTGGSRFDDADDPGVEPAEPEAEERR